MKAGVRQRGAALLTAMIIVTLIASLAAGMVWQQYRAVQIEAADRARAQSAWILQGALDWARLILREDGKTIDHLGEPWAVPLAEARLSTFLAADRSAATDDEGPEAFLSGSIEDAQSRYNLRNLLVGGKEAELEQRVLERLCSQVNAPPGTAAVIIEGLRSAFPVPPSSSASALPPGVAASVPDSVPSSESGPLRPANLDQLRWMGLDADTIKRLQPYVVLLDKPTPVNLNTAPREVIAALFDNVDLGTAERMVTTRKAKPLQNVDEAKAQLGNVDMGNNRAAVASSFFIVTGRLRLDERQLEQRSLVERVDRRVDIRARERINQLLDR